MTEYLGKKYVPAEQDFFSGPSFEVASCLIGCVLHHDIPGEDTAIMIVESEAYHENDNAIYGNKPQLLAHGHAHVYYSRAGMLALDLVCDAEGRASSVLIRSGCPVLGFDTMIKRRGKYVQSIRTGAKGFEKNLCNGPCKLVEALAIDPSLDEASLFKAPFRIFRPVEPVTNLLIGSRANVEDLRPWRWGHAEYKYWLSQPSFPTKEKK